LVPSEIEAVIISRKARIDAPEPCSTSFVAALNEERFSRIRLIAIALLIGLE